MVHGADNPNFKDGVHDILTPDVTLIFKTRVHLISVPDENQYWRRVPCTCLCARVCLMSRFVHVTRKGLWECTRIRQSNARVFICSLAPMTWSMLKGSKRCEKSSEMLTDKSEVFMGNLPRHPEPTYKVNALYLMVLLQEMLKS